MTRISEVQDEATRQDYNYIKTFSKRMLKTHLFIGSFKEKRFVEPLNSYRDVVTINSEERDFIENVIAVRKKLTQEFLRKSVWVGITEPHTVGAPIGYNLWVVLPIEIFGRYWFKVKSVEFLSNEVRVKLDVVRPLKCEKSTSDASEAEDNQSFDLKSSVQNISANLGSNLLDLFREYLTASNIKTSVIFIFLLIGTIITGGANIMKYFMEYLLKLMREVSGLLHVCTPIIISCINLVGKTIYGFYTLIITLWYGKPLAPQPPVYNSYYNVEPDRMLEFRNSKQQYYGQRALPYKRSSVTITPLDD